MRFYVASGLENRELAADMVRFIAERGHMPIYDWTEHGDVRGQGEDRLMEVASNDLFAVRDSEIAIFLLPGDKVTHTELGIALATRSNKRIMLWSSTGKEFEDGSDTCVFYHHRGVERIVCSFAEFKKQLSAIL